jgi:hypothetical protein
MSVKMFRWEFKINPVSYSLTQGGFSLQVYKTCIDCERKYHPWTWQATDQTTGQVFEGEHQDVSNAKRLAEQAANLPQENSNG